MLLLPEALPQVSESTIPLSSLIVHESFSSLVIGKRENHVSLLNLKLLNPPHHLFYTIFVDDLTEELRRSFVDRNWILSIINANRYGRENNSSRRPPYSLAHIGPALVSILAGSLRNVTTICVGTTK